MLRRMVGSYETWSKADLISRICQLETQNEATKVAGTSLKDISLSSEPLPEQANKRKKEFDFGKFQTRRVAIRFAYLGWNYRGLAVQKDTSVVTVEQRILESLAKTRCIPSTDPSDCEFSRCGRTDRDVSAMAQVISLRVRSLLTPEEQLDKNNDSRELDYLRTLNSQLPNDIFAYEICLRPPDGFDARFSCMYRHYRYFFDSSLLDVNAMRLACQSLVGEHDFRNLCKIDASKQITNYVRLIHSAEIVEHEGSLTYLELKGNAFLWNQVRSIMAILFMVGKGQEPPSIVERLLDIEKTPQRPTYAIAWGVPLVLYDCAFPEMEWQSSSRLKPETMYGTWYNLLQQTNMARAMIDKIIPILPEAKALDTTGYHTTANVTKHIPLFDRPLMKSPETVNREWLEKKQAKGK